MNTKQTDFIEDLQDFILQEEERPMLCITKGNTESFRKVVSDEEAYEMGKQAAQDLLNAFKE